MFQEAALKYPCPRMFLGLQRLFRIRAAQRHVPRGSNSFWVKRHDLFHGRGKLRARVLGESQHRLPQLLHYLISAGDLPHVKRCWMLYAANGASELLCNCG